MNYTIDTMHASGQGVFNSPFASYIDKNRTDTYSVGIKLTMPIYDGGTRVSQLRQEREAVSQSVSQLAQARATAVDNVNSNWWLVDAARSRIEGSAARLKAARIALQGAQRQFSDGRATLREVLLARQKVNEAEISETQARYELLTATAKLLAAIGRFDAKSLGLPVKLYDPLIHYDNVTTRWFQ